jgi:DNA-binding CsgD family transcriptional regulator
MTTLELAAQAFELLGARPWAELALAELRAAAAPVNQSPSEPTTITAQERRVAVLAAQGQTTKQIAERLSLSPRTIEAHLSRVFRKLGITRRGALSTALLHRDSELRPRGDDFVEIKGA